MARIDAPWTEVQVEALNAWQRSPWVHPFTCPARGEPAHAEAAAAAGLDGEGVLVAAIGGWTCPCCDYVQGWTHDFMADRAALEEVAREMARLGARP
jgi:hypothetical protein